MRIVVRKHRDCRLIYFLGSSSLENPGGMYFLRYQIVMDMGVMQNELARTPNNSSKSVYREHNSQGRLTS